MATFKTAQLQPFSLSGAGSAINDTTLTLTSFKDIDGNQLSMSNFGDKGYGTVEPGSSSQEESISFTGITVNADGSVTLSGVSHGLFLYPYTETAGMTKAHNGGTQFIISNTSLFYANFVNLGSDAVVTGNWYFKGGVRIEEFASGNSGTSKTLDWSVDSAISSTLTGNVTFTFTPPANPSHLTLKLSQDATGSRLVTWPTNVHWSGGGAPTLTTTANRVDIIVFYFDGTTYFGQSALNFVA